MTSRLAVLALSVIALTTLGASTAAAEPAGGAPKTTKASIKGWARMHYPAPGNNVQVQVNAHAEYTSRFSNFPARTWGTFRVYHRVERPGDQPPVVVWGDFKVDCLTTGGPNATVTGILKRSSEHWKDLVGTRMGVSFYVPDEGPGRIGLTGPTNPLLTKCMAPAANSRLIKGGYRLKARTLLDR